MAKLDYSVGAISKEIVMTLNKGVEDDQLGQYYRRVGAIADRLGKSLPFKDVMEVLQRIHDGEFGQLGFPAEAKTVDSGIFRLVVDYGQTLEQMIAAGRYDWKNSDITAARFPVNGRGVVEYEARYFHFDHNTSSEDNIAAMKKDGWGPAEIEHLLAHGKTSPDEQRKFSIVALGSVAKVGFGHHVPCLSRDDSERLLSLDWFGLGWDPFYRFLAVRKVSVA